MRGSHRANVHVGLSSAISTRTIFSKKNKNAELNFTIFKLKCKVKINILLQKRFRRPFKLLLLSPKQIF